MLKNEATFYLFLTINKSLILSVKISYY